MTEMVSAPPWTESVRVGDDPSRWPDASVILLIHNPGEHEASTVDLVRRQSYDGRVVLRAIDSSPDPTSRWSTAIRNAVDDWEAIAPGAFRHGRTRNRAVDGTTTPIVVYLSQDAHPATDGWLRSLVRPLVDGKAEAAYGRQLPPAPDAERDATFTYLYPEEPKVKTKDRIAELGVRTFHFSDVTSAFPTDLLKAVRFPNEIPIFEDIAVAKRLLDRGHRIAYVPDALVYHAHRMGIRKLVSRYRQIGAVYERLGIFDELRNAGVSLFREGASTAAGVSSNRRRTLAARSGAVLLGGLKLASVTAGRWQASMMEFPSA